MHIALFLATLVFVVLSNPLLKEFPKHKLEQLMQPLSQGYQRSKEARPLLHELDVQDISFECTKYLVYVNLSRCSLWYCSE